VLSKRAFFRLHRKRFVYTQARFYRQRRDIFEKRAEKHRGYRRVFRSHFPRKKSDFMRILFNLYCLFAMFSLRIFTALVEKKT
jgi:hypothetical protein